MHRTIVVIVTCGIFLLSFFFSARRVQPDRDRGESALGEAALEERGGTDILPQTNAGENSLTPAEELALVRRMNAYTSVSPRKVDGGIYNVFNPWLQKGPYGMSVANPWGEEVTYSGMVSALSCQNNSGTYTPIIGTLQGGIWKKSGATMVNITDNLVPSLRVGAVAVDPNDPQTIYFGTGFYDHNSYPGVGLWKTTNGGQNWDSCHLNPIPLRISKIVIRDNAVYLSSDGGLYSSTDNGNIWNLDQAGNFSDVTISASGTKLLYATSRGATAHVWILDASKAGAKWKQVSWKQFVTSTGKAITDSSGMDRLAIACYRLDPSIAYVQIGSSYAPPTCWGLFKTTNSGLKWTKVTTIPAAKNTKNQSVPTWGQEWYNNAIIVDPTSSHIVYSAAGCVWRSDDDGTTWNIKGAVNIAVDRVHGDIHALMFAGSTLYVGSDGGIFYSTDRGETWNSHLNKQLPTMLLTDLDVYRDGSDEFQGAAAQDNGCLSTTDPTAGTWTLASLGDGLAAFIFPTGHYFYFDNNQSVGAYLDPSSFTFDATTVNTGNTGPVVTPHFTGNAATGQLFVNSGNKILISDDLGKSWYTFSNLTFPLGVAQPSLSKDGITLYAPAQNPSGAEILDRLDKLVNFWVHSTTQTGLTVSKVLRVCPSIQYANKAWAITNDKFHRIFESTDRGATWQSIADSLDSHLAVNDLVDDGLNIYIATDHGVWTRHNNETTWTPWVVGMPPTTEVRAIKRVVRGGNKYLVAGTYGRSTFERRLLDRIPIVSFPNLIPIMNLYEITPWASMEKTVTVKNSGADTLHIFAVQSTDTTMRITPPSADILPGDSLQFTVDFLVPNTPGEVYSPVVSFFSNADESPSTFTFSGHIGDLTTFRSFAMESLLTAKPISLVSKAKSWSFSLVNTSIPASRSIDLYVKFASAVDGFISTNPYHNATPIDRGKTLWKFTGGIVGQGDTATLTGVATKGKLPVIKKWYWEALQSVWVDNSETTEKTIFPGDSGKILPVAQGVEDRMPNDANFRAMVMRRFSRESPMIIGARNMDNVKTPYAAFSSEADLYSSLGNHKLFQNGTPRWFDTWERSSKPIIGKQSKLPPQKYNNRLFGEVIALSLNVAGSDQNILPSGFGDLRFVDPSSRLNGLRVRVIEQLADHYLSNGDTTGFGSATDLHAVIHRINGAFCGPIDTISFANGLKFTGVCPLARVPFLEKMVTTIPDVNALNGGFRQVPREFALDQNYPNPFNPTTDLGFRIAEAGFVTMKVYDVVGKEVATLVHEKEEPGEHHVRWDASGKPSGVYFYRLTVDPVADMNGILKGRRFSNVKKMVLVK